MHSDETNTFRLGSGIQDFRRASGYARTVTPEPRESRDQQPCPLCGAPVRQDRLNTHMEKKCPKNPHRTPKSAAYKAKPNAMYSNQGMPRCRTDSLPGWWHGGE